MALVTNNTISKLLFNNSCKYDDEKFLVQYEKLNTLFRLFNPTRLFWLMPELISRQMNDRKQLKAANRMFVGFCKDNFMSCKPVENSEKEPECVSDLLWQKFLSEEKDSYFKFDDVPHILVDLFVAGQETTATTLTWAFLNLMHSPDVQEKVFKELSREFPDGNSIIPYSASMSLPYTMATINEVQRFTPVTFSTIDHVAVDDIYDFHGFFIPKGTRVFPNLALLHTNPKLWKDSANFNPDNFLDDNGLFAKSPYLIPFGVGLRSCPGELIAKMEMFMVFANVLRRFKVTPAAKLPPLKASIGLVSSPPHFDVILESRDT